ncbi:hypothetical protein ABZ366_25850 [Streptomyces sp. NPDC005904]|uniref:hypothetical protein n=1 Tax=Streptomyces sp. NPDC005904 TaxID=3154570 RepID=UPI0033F6DE8F
MRAPTVLTALGLTAAAVLAATVPAAAATALPERPHTGAAVAPARLTAAPTPPGQEPLGGVLGSLVDVVTNLLGSLVGPAGQGLGTKDLTNGGATDGRQAPLTPQLTLPGLGTGR